MSRVTVLDSTLRDGAQSEGISFSVRDKMRVVSALDELGVDLIEAGNPGSNPKDIEFFRAIRSQKLANATLAAFGSTRRKGVKVEDDEGVRSLLEAETETVVIFGKSWTFHVEKILRATHEENLDMIRETVAYFKSKGRRVIYDAEHFFDGHVANPGYAMASLRAAAEGGAECLVLCDTNGGSLPGRIAELTKAAGALGVPLGIHAHNDSGLAVANSLAAVEAGAVHVQGTLVGFGERCGNANLSTIVADLELKMRLSCLREGSLPKLAAVTRRVAEIANVGFDEGMPFVGLKAFAHKGGMHVDAVIKTPASFEHVDPESVGNERRILASEVGGRAVVIERVKRIDPAATRESPLVAQVVKRLKEMEALGYQFEGAEASLDLLMRKAAGKYKPFFQLGHYRTIGEQPSGDREHCAQAMVKIAVDGVDEISAAEGDGPVHALDLALRRALERFYPNLSEMRLADYKVRVIDLPGAGTGATASTVRVLIESADSDEAWTTVGVSTDIIEASWIALVDSIEFKLIKDLERRFKPYLS
ncbi:MAG TPA: citramalate synthase [Rectinemataceae bacterium]|nr:citramalate synthase [Rectinemataceae bacterium]